MSRIHPTSTAVRTTASRRRLRQVLALDAVVTGVNGLAYVLLASPLESLLGVPTDVLRPIGAFLIAFGGGVAVVAARPDPSRVATLTIIGSNATWAAASLLTLALESLSRTLVGGIWIVAQALVVTGFAVAQRWTLRQLP